jgi:hypothetical protein
MTANGYRGIFLTMTAVLGSMFVAPEPNETLAARPHPGKSAATHSAGTPVLRITNFTDGETLRYPVALLLGTLGDRNETKVAVLNRSAPKETGRQSSGIAQRGRFKALVELQPGKNELEVSAGQAKLSCVLHYHPQTNPYVVRMVYVTDKSGNTDYQTPVANDAQDFRGKFDTALKLMQCFTAEDMNAHGYGRRTFNLEFDEHGRVVTHVVKAALSAEEYWKETDDGRWYEAAGDAIGKQIPNPMAKDLAVLAFTSFDPATKRNRAHLALGGGNLAVFGGSGIYTWPNSIADVQRACLDATMTDVSRFASDSVGRNAYWANTSTQTGACLHELGHAFGLPHSADYNGIMVRGIDNFTRKFVFVDPPSAANAQTVEFQDSEIGHWEPVSLAAMAFTRHFALDKRPWSQRDTIALELDAKAGCVTVRSEDGLRFVGVDGPGRADVFMPIDIRKPAPRRVDVPLAIIGRRVASREAELRVVDAEGNMRNVLVRDIAKDVDSGALAMLLAGPFVRTWQFSKVTLPWSGPPAFAAVDAARLKEIVASALECRPVTAPDNFVDFTPQFPPGKRENVAGYVVRKLVSAKPRQVRLLTGSDDALRTWLNGRVVQEVPANRDAKADSESCDANLPKGESILVAEVSQGNGGWGLILRLQDADGHDLAIADDGQVVEWPNQDCREKRLGTREK